MAAKAARELVLWWAPIPQTAQESFFDDDTTDGNVLFQGGWGSGKTMTLTAKMLKLSAINAPLPGLWTVPDYGHIHDTILPMLQEVDPDSGQPWFLRPDQFHYHETHHVLTWEGGGPIHFASAENPASIAGPNMAYAGVDEPGSIKHEAWRNTCARVRHAGAKLRQKIASGTPEGITYLLDYFGPDRTDKYRLYTMRTAENVELLKHSPDYIEQQMAGMTETEALAYLNGQAVPTTGALAYPTFDPNLHWTLEVPPADRAIPLDLMFDFNVDPLVCPIGQRVPGPYGDEAHIVDMVTLYGGSTIDQICNEILKRYLSWPAGFRVFGDATGRARHVKNLQSNYDLIAGRLRIAGPVEVRVPTVNPPVARRISSVNRMFQNALHQIRCWVRKTEPARACVTRPLVMSLQQTQKKTGTDDLEKKSGETITHASDALGYWLDHEWPAVRVSSAAAIRSDFQADTPSLAVQMIRERKAEAFQIPSNGNGHGHPGNGNGHHAHSWADIRAALEAS